MSPHLTYLALELGWALPVLVVQWAAGGAILWRARRRLGGVVLLATLYLGAADRVAIASGIWTINPARTVGVAVLGLPLEEGVFFLLTDLIVVQSLVLFRSAQTRAGLARLGPRLRRAVSGNWSGGSSEERAQTIRARASRGYRRGLAAAMLGAVASGATALLTGQPTIVEPFAEAVMALTPLPVATALVTGLGGAGEVATVLGTLGGLAIFLVVGGALGALARLGPERSERPPIVPDLGIHSPRLVAAVGTIGLIVWAAASVSWVEALAGVLPLAAVVGWSSPVVPVEASSPDNRPGGADRTRRRVVMDSALLVGGALTVSGLGLARGYLSPRLAPPFERALAGRVDGGLEVLLPLQGETLGISDLTPMLTTVDQFYRMSKDAQDPLLGPESWRLIVGGHVERTLSLGLSDLLARAAVTRFVTLECVDNPIGGRLMGNGCWTGVRLADLVATAGPTRAATRIVCVGADGEDEDLPLADLARLDPILAYALNGQRLPTAHGFPLRLIVPGYYGYKNVKWVTRIELATDGLGFWARRGWASLPPIASTARIDLARPLAPGAPTLLVGGVALAGPRSVERVDLRTDHGDWAAAELGPSLGAAAWRQWKITLPDDGSEGVVARVVDGTGAVPPDVEVPTFPSGARGWTRARIAR